MKRRLFVLGIIIIIGALGSIWLAHAQATITVNTFVDGPGACPATCTLRAAILAANPGDTIEFSGSGTIDVNAAGGLGELPSLTVGGVTIDAGANDIVLDGSQSPGIDPPLAYGLRINSDDNVILGLEITSFDGDGILIEAGDGNQIGGEGANEGNLIHLNGGNGIVLDDSGSQISPNVIVGNLIGTDAIGTSVEANDGAGIVIRNGSEFNTIGGGTATAANIISGNNNGGILINGSNDNTVEGNRVGLDGGTGVTGLGNGGMGIRIENGSTNNAITDNAIAASTGDGVTIEDSDDNSITDNLIGLDAFFGMVGIGNGGYGVRLLNANGTTVTGNSVADNDSGGILIANGSSNTDVSNNRVGLGANGTTALANNGQGIQIDTANDNTIDNNSIAANNGDGVGINGGAGNTVSNNRIGLNQSLGASGNAGNGVFITGGTDHTVSDNTIGNNTGDGVFVASGTGNTIDGNTMLNNGGLGIDLGANGVTANDAGDGDAGANGLQNFPVITSALFDGVTTEITGTLNSTPGTTFALEFFANAVCDPSDHGEAETVLGTTINLTTGGGGNANFVANIGGLAPGDFVTVTATRPDGSTSEFALCEEVLPGPPVAGFSATPTSGNAPLTVNFTDESTGLITDYLWDFGDGNTSTLQNPVNVFANPGTYVVQLTVTGPGGSDTATLTIIVTAPGSTQPPSTSPPSTSPPQIAPSATLTGSITPSATGSLTPTLRPTATPSFTPTATLTRTSTATRTPSLTPTLTATATFTLTPSATRTPTATRTSTATPTLTRTFTPTYTVTASFTPTLTGTPLPTSTPTATATPDLGVTKVADEDGFRVIVDNAGQTAANNVGLVEALRPGVRYISSRPGAPICIEDAGVVYCTLGRIAGGDSAAVDFAVNTDGTDPTSGRTIITSDGVQLVIVDEPYLLKIGEPPVAGPGATVTYTLRMINPTNETALQVRVEDRMPDTLIIESASASTGTVTVQGQNIAYSLDRLEAGGRATITVIARVRQSDTGADEIFNRACLTSQSNRVPSCAQMRFVRAGELPSTGEEPFSRWLIAAGIAALGILLASGLALINRRR